MKLIEEGGKLFLQSLLFPPEDQPAFGAKGFILRGVFVEPVFVPESGIDIEGDPSIREDEVRSANVANGHVEEKRNPSLPERYLDDSLDGRAGARKAAVVMIGGSLELAFVVEADRWMDVFGQPLIPGLSASGEEGSFLLADQLPGFRAVACFLFAQQASCKLIFGKGASNMTLKEATLALLHTEPTAAGAQRHGEFASMPMTGYKLVIARRGFTAATRAWTPHHQIGLL